MEDYKKTIVVLASIRALVTTSILVMAGICIVRMIDYPLYYLVVIAASIVTCCVITGWSYYMDLSGKNIVKSWRDLIQTFELEWSDNIDMILKGWLYGIATAVVIVVTSILGVFAPLPAVAILLFGVEYSFVARNECKTMKDRLRYFVTGYLYGCGAVICGSLLSILMDRFGAPLVLGAFALDILITGTYVYMDLIQWEYDQKAAAEKEKRRLEELATKESV